VNDTPELRVHLTRQQLVRYAGASGDFNQIHYSDHYARALGLDGVIAHGMLTMGLALRLVTDWAGDPVRVEACSFRFSKPVPVPDDADGTEVVFTGTVTDDGEGPIQLAIAASCGDVQVGRGKATVRRG
jgi:acyl dehydratase